LPREPSHSGRAQSADRKILTLVSEALAERGAELEELDARRLRNSDIGDSSIILSMARSIENLTRLGSHREGVRIINEPMATMQTLRDRLYPRLAETTLGLPATRLVDVRDDISDMNWPYWLKRKDYHHLLPNDVVRVDDEAGLAAARRHFVVQDHPFVFQQQHVIGQDVKAYCVYSRAEDALTFFATREQINDAANEQLRQIAENVVKAVPLEVFGADFVLTDDGPALVDVNAWPSFRQCLTGAAEAIADMVWTATPPSKHRATSG